MHKQQSALTVILKLVFGGLTSVVLIVLGTVFSSRVVCFHFFEACSQNCGSYSLGIMSSLLYLGLQYL